ncbi:hypothetical protein ACQKQC_18745 [Vibrio fortis]|uniref:hypothetical protein n=1 Tax=Vibrio fortis TaxID=212667 RepID=UPI004067610E
MNLVKISDLIAKQGINLVNKTAMPIEVTVEFHIDEIPFSLYINEEDNGTLNFSTNSPILWKNGRWVVEGKPYKNTVELYASHAFNGAIDDSEYPTKSKFQSKRAFHILNAMIAEFLDELDSNNELIENVIARAKAFNEAIALKRQAEEEQERQEIEAAKIEFEQNYAFLTKSKIADMLAAGKKESLETRSDVTVEFTTVNLKTYKLQVSKVTFNSQGKPKLGFNTTKLKDIKEKLEAAVEPK